jgi:MazG family protein
MNDSLLGTPADTEHVVIVDDPATETVRLHFGRLYNIMRELRAKCPWDKEQTHDSLRPYLLEETYEVLETLDQRHYDELKKEMGDLLLQILFHSIIEQEQKRFDLSDVVRSLNDKLIRRHPHVFGTVEVSGSDQVLENWEQIKLNEPDRNSVLDGVPKNLPALVRAARVQEKASRVGFDWGHIDDVWKKVHEEIDELKEAHQNNDPKKTEEELGDLLFSIVNIARFLPANPEDALRGTIEKFIRRFQHVERRFNEQNLNMKDATLDEMDVYWNEAKRMSL